MTVGERALGQVAAVVEPRSGVDEEPPPLDTRYVLRVDRLTMALVAAGLVLIIVVAVLVTVLVTRSAPARGNSQPSTQPSGAAPHGPTVTLNGPEVAAYITKSYADSGVTCPSLRTAVGGTFVCSDSSGDAFTVKVINSGGAYTVHPN